MANTIKHQGVIEHIQGTHIQVRITQTSACASCSIKGHCTSADTKEKIIDVFDNAASQYQVGQEVWVVGTLSMGIQAVLFAFLLLFAFLTLLYILFVFGYNGVYCHCILFDIDTGSDNTLVGIQQYGVW